MGPAAIGQDSPEIFREISVSNLSAGGGAADLQGPNVVRSRYVEIDLARILAPGAPEDPEDRRPSRARGESRKRLTFNLFTDAVQEFEEDRAEHSADGQSYSWYGRSPVAGGGQALLVVRDGNVAGSVRTASGEFYRIRSVTSSVHVIRQVIYQGTPPVDDAIPVPETEVPQAAKAEQAAAVAQQSAAATLDVMVVYTAAARQAAGGASGIQSEIQLAIAELNQSFTNSAVQMQARLVHSAEVSYNEQTDLSTSLARLRTPGDGHMDQVHALRDQYGADVVALLINGPGSNGGTVGTGYVMQTVGSYFSAYAFSVTEVNFATGPAYALLHEIGHNLGCAHDRAHASSAGAYPYAYGYQRTVSPRFRDIMSYNCSGVNCPTINYWSNPNVNYQGYPTGVSSTASSSADNSLSLNNTKATAAAWRATGASGGGGGTSQYAPSAVSVSPSSGSGSSRTFSYTFSDGNGYADLQSAVMLINDSLRAQGGCFLNYVRSSNALYLANDAFTVWQGPITPGSSGTVQNSQCSLNGSASSVSASGNTLTINAALTFKSSFTGSKTNYMVVHDNSALTSDWQSRGTWTVSGVAAGPSPTAPTAVSVTPSSGSGSSRTFGYTFSDANGYADIQSFAILINDSLRAQGGCFLNYIRSSNRLYLANDAFTVWQGPITPGSSGTIQNSQCSLNGSASSISASGNALTINAALTFKSSFTGTKTHYMVVHDNGALTSDWQIRGTWAVAGAAATNAPPTAVSATPSSGSGASQTFGYTFSDSNGYADLQSVVMLINSSLSPQGGCFLNYIRSSNRLYLANDAFTVWLGPITPGSAGTVQNSQCTLNGGASSVSASGNTLTINAALTFKSNFAGSKTNYVVAHDNSGLTSDWQVRGSWTVP